MTLFSKRGKTSCQWEIVEMTERDIFSGTSKLRLTVSRCAKQWLYVISPPEDGALVSAGQRGGVIVHGGSGSQRLWGEKRRARRRSRYVGAGREPPASGGWPGRRLLGRRAPLWGPALGSLGAPPPPGSCGRADWKVSAESLELWFGWEDRRAKGRVSTRFQSGWRAKRESWAARRWGGAAEGRCLGFVPPSKYERWVRPDYF